MIPSPSKCLAREIQNNKKFSKLASRWSTTIAQALWCSEIPTKIFKSCNFDDLFPIILTFLNIKNSIQARFDNEEDASFDFTMGSIQKYKENCVQFFFAFYTAK